MPDDVSVIGFDDIEVAAYVGLTTVRQPLAASGERVGEILIAQLGGEPRRPTHEVLPLEVVIRRTTAPSPQRHPSRPGRRRLRLVGPEEGGGGGQPDGSS